MNAYKKKKLWLFVAFWITQGQMNSNIAVSVKQQWQQIDAKCARVVMCKSSYHIELLPHGTPVSQSWCHLCDDRVFIRDDCLELPTNKHQHMNEN